MDCGGEGQYWLDNRGVGGPDTIYYLRRLISVSFFYIAGFFKTAWIIYIYCFHSFSISTSKFWPCLLCKWFGTPVQWCLRYWAENRGLMQSRSSIMLIYGIFSAIVTYLYNPNVRSGRGQLAKTKQPLFWTIPLKKFEIQPPIWKWKSVRQTSKLIGTNIHCWSFFKVNQFPQVQISFIKYIPLLGNSICRSVVKPEHTHSIAVEWTWQVVELISSSTGPF